MASRLNPPARSSKSTLDDLLDLLPDNSTGEISALDLRVIVTDLWARDDAAETRIAALEAASSGGDSFSVTGIWQVNPGAGAIPQGGQLAGNTTTLGTATILKFAALDRLNQDATAALMASTALFMQMRMNSANWVTFNVSGTPSVAGGIITVPVTVAGSSGTAGAAAWQEASVVVNVETSGAIA